MVQGQRAPSCFGSCPHVPNTPKFHLPFASGRFFVTIASGTLYTETCYAVTPCADTAHTPARVRELAAMKRIIVLALLTFLCLALRASSRMQVKQRPPSGWHRAEAKTKRHPLNMWSAYNAPCPSGWCWSTGPTPFL